MPQSRRFRSLVKRLNTLQSHFLPRQFSPLGQYSALEHDLARAYILLVHAEIESYLEDRASDIAGRAERVWRRAGRHTKIIKRLVGFHNLTKGQPWIPFEKSPPRIAAAINSYTSSVHNNQGIKENNICKLLFPIGIEYKDLNVTWLASLDSFGTFRGSLAHSSIKTQQPIDPETESKRVAEILRGLKKLDSKISGLK